MRERAEEGEIGEMTRGERKKNITKNVKEEDRRDT